MKGFVTGQVARLNATIDEALQHLPDTGTGNEVPGCASITPGSGTATTSNCSPMRCWPSRSRKD
jgi:hypothetical protein